jgi:hypothetical protein
MQELEPARAMIHRLRTRDLFAFSGEIILSAERRTQLQLGGGGATDKIKQQLIELLRQKGVADAENASTESKAGATENAATGELS